jgi:hypothetical protein
MNDKTKLFFVALFVGTVIIVLGFFLSNQFNNSNEDFGIYLLEDELVVSGNDILSYNKTSHEIKLSQEGIDRLTTLELVRKPFEVRLGDRVIYNGSFWSAIISSTSSSAVIIDVLLIQSGSTSILKIDPCYPIQMCEGQDPRNNPEIFEYFQRTGKLIQ